MAGEEEDPQEKARAQLREFRRMVANMVGELRSQEVRDTYAAITLGEIVNQHLLYLVGNKTKPGRKQRMEQMFKEFEDNIEAIKATPVQNFRAPDPKNDVNTEV